MSFSDFIALLSSKACQQTYGYIGKHKPLDPSRPTYLSVNLESAYIPYVRKGIDKFYATLYGNISLSPDADAKTSFQVIDTLSSLPEIKELDARHLDRIALGPHRLLDDVPYRYEGLHERRSERHQSAQRSHRGWSERLAVLPRSRHRYRHA